VKSAKGKIPHTMHKVSDKVQNFPTSF